MTEETPGHPMLERVRKLLAKAEGTDNPVEALTYNEKAAELIARYGIEQALLNAGRAERERAIVGDRTIHVVAPYAGEKAALLHNIAKPLGVETIRLQGRRSDGLNVHLFGLPADLERVELLFTSLLLQASRGLTTPHASRYGEATVTYRKNWMWGFITAVKERLEVAENRARQATDATSDGPSTDLVLADREALVQRRVSEVYPKLKNLRSVNLGGTGYDDGQAAGRRADLGGTRITNPLRNAIGR